MDLKLPKKVLRFLIPKDNEHEARLAVIWKIYRSAVKSYFKGEMNESSFIEFEYEVLHEIFAIPSDKHILFRGHAPKPAEVTLNHVWNAIDAFGKTRKRKPAKFIHPPAPRPKGASKPVILVRRASRSDDKG